MFDCTLGGQNDPSFCSFHWQEDLGGGTRFRGQKATQTAVLGVQEDGLVELSKKACIWEYPKWELCEEFTFWGCFSPGPWEQLYEEDSSKSFPL